jgi:hypothetical protein
MGIDATARRRWFGALALGGALLMLAAGATVLSGRLTGMGFLLYWGACLALTVVAILTAFIDMRAVQYELRQEKHELIQSTIQNIQKDAQTKARAVNGKPQRKE